MLALGEDQGGFKQHRPDDADPLQLPAGNLPRPLWLLFSTAGLRTMESWERKTGGTGSHLHCLC